MKSFFKVLFQSIKNSFKNNEHTAKEKKFSSFRKMIKEYDIYSNIINVILGILVLVSGMVLIISAAYPPLIERVKILSDIMSISFLKFSHRVSLLIGLMLIVVSKEILDKVKRAYYLTFVLLIAGGTFTFLKGLDYEEAIFVFIVLVLLRLSKDSFYRKSAPIRLINYISASTIIIFITGLWFNYMHKYNSQLFNLKGNKYEYYVKLISTNRHYIIWAVITYAIFIAFLIAWYKTANKIENDHRYESIDRNRLSEFLNNTTYGNALTHLTYLGDKDLFWALDGTALVPYTKHKDKIIVLGDPIVGRDKLSQCIQEFQSFLDDYGYKPSFYQVDEDNLSIYHDNGYYFFKLGEEAVVDLETFNLIGSKKSSFRNILRRFEKDGFRFEVIEPPFTAEFIQQLKVVSDEWLGDRKEKGFSMGWFDQEYLQRAPIAILRDLDDEIIAFISIMYSYDGESVAIDLMRLRKNVPNSTMEYLMLSLILYFKGKAYKRFNLGEAPLSNVGFTPNSHLQEKVARLIYNYGQVFYSFVGLRKYKEKFSPQWEPRYLAYSSFFSLPDILMDCIIVSSSPKRK